MTIHLFREFLLLSLIVKLLAEITRNAPHTFQHRWTFLSQEGTDRVLASIVFIFVREIVLNWAENAADFIAPLIFLFGTTKCLISLLALLNSLLTS